MTSFRRIGIMERGLRSLCQTALREFGAPGRLVEVGSYAGESAVVFAAYYPVVVCVDPWGEEAVLAVAAGLPAEEVERCFDARARAAGNITKLKMPSVPAARRFPDGFFDGAYIDAAHDYASVRADIEAWRPKCRYFLAGHDWDDAPRKECDVSTAVLDSLGMPEWLFEDGSWLKRLGRAGP